jgi:hypothetical protein
MKLVFEIVPDVGGAIGFSRFFNGVLFVGLFFLTSERFLSTEKFIKTERLQCSL